MTAFKRAEPVPYSVDRAITASAARVNIANKSEAETYRKRSSANAQWQSEAWTYYDAIGEIKFAYNLVASILSRVRLYVGVVVDPNSPPVPVAQAVADPEDKTDDNDLVDDASDARNKYGIDEEFARKADEAFAKQMRTSSISQMMRNLSLNLNVPGECYLVLEDGKWTARSTSEIRIAPGADKYEVRRSRSDSSMQRYLKDDATVGRVWRNHPEYSMDPDSAMLGLRADCEELILLSRVVRSIARSKLNAGFLYIPDEVSAVARTNPDDGSEESEAEGDPLETELLYSLTDPISSEQSSAGVVPMLLRGPADLGDKIKYITIERKADDFIVNRAERALERILQGLDAPKDVVTGLANVKYANAIQIDEGMYKAHIEPMAIMICDAVTDIILRPTLRALGFTDEEQLARAVIWYDPSEVVTRPNRSDDADKGYDKYLLSGSAWRDVHGFSDTDAPNEDEVAFRVAMDKAQVPPELATVLYNKLLPKITEEAKTANQLGGQGLPPELNGMLNGNDPESPPVGLSSVPKGIAQ